MPLLETDSLEVLEQRQLISTLMECRKWDLAEWEIEKFRHAVNPDSPRVRQELSLFLALDTSSPRASVTWGLIWKVNAREQSRALQWLQVFI